jgi:hypothetical protein
LTNNKTPPNYDLEGWRESDRLPINANNTNGSVNDVRPGKMPPFTQPIQQLNTDDKEQDNRQPTGKILSIGSPQGVSPGVNPVVSPGVSQVVSPGVSRRTNISNQSLNSSLSSSATLEERQRPTDRAHYEYNHTNTVKAYTVNPSTVPGLPYGEQQRTIINKGPSTPPGTQLNESLFKKDPNHRRPLSPHNNRIPVPDKVKTKTVDTTANPEKGNNPPGSNTTEQPTPTIQDVEVATGTATDKTMELHVSVKGNPKIPKKKLLQQLNANNKVKTFIQKFNSSYQGKDVYDYIIVHTETEANKASNLRNASPTKKRLGGYKSYSTKKGLTRTRKQSKHLHSRRVKLNKKHYSSTSKHKVKRTHRRKTYSAK